MQYKNGKILHLTNILGEIITEIRLTKTDKSKNKLENEYDIASGKFSRIESGKIDPQFSTIWKISESLGVKCSEIVKQLEDKLGDDFKLIDE